MGTIVKLLQHIKLRNEHINGLKKTPFWALFNAILQNKLNYKQCRKYDNIALKIIQTYQRGSSGSFQLGPKTVKLTTEDIKSIFGISCGDEPIHLGYGNKSRSSFLTRRSIQTETLSSTTIIDLLQKALKGKKKEDTEDVIRMLLRKVMKKLMTLKKNKKKMLKNTEDEEQEDAEEEEQKVQEQTFKSNMVAIVKLLQHIKLRNEHINALKKTPFWALFDAILKNKMNCKQCSKFDDISLKIIQTYQPGSSGSFQLGPETVKLTTEDIKSIFGISCGDEPIHLGYGNKSRSSFLTRRYIQTETLSSTTITNLLQKTLKGKKKKDTEDVIRMLCMYTCLKLFFSTSRTIVGWVFLNYMEDIKSMRKYNWAEAIRNTLMSSIEKYQKNPAKVTGCVMVLLYWLCEYTLIIHPELSQACPRVIKWNLAKLHKRMKVISLHQLITRQVTTAQLNEESDEELDDTEKEEKEDAENAEDAEEKDAEEEKQEVQEQEQQKQDAENIEEEEEESEEDEEEEDGQYDEKCHQEQKPTNEDFNDFCNIILNDAPEGEEQIHQQTLEKLQTENNNLQLDNTVKTIYINKLKEDSRLLTAQIKQLKDENSRLHNQLVEKKVHEITQEVCAVKHSGRDGKNEGHTINDENSQVLQKVVHENSEVVDKELHQKEVHENSEVVDKELHQKEFHEITR
ncbi:hypothetical protein ACSBR1_005510 [Camellia fascicularis]